MEEFIELKVTITGRWTANARGTICTGEGETKEIALHDVATQLLALVERQKKAFEKTVETLLDLSEQLRWRT